MCKFCDALKQEKKIKWEMRSTYADDNSCEAINGVSCSYKRMQDVIYYEWQSQ